MSLASIRRLSVLACLLAATTVAAAAPETSASETRAIERRARETRAIERHARETRAIERRAREARAIELRATVEAPAAELYRLFSTSDGVRTLFPGAEAEIDSTVGGLYRVAFDPDGDPGGRSFGTAGCRILALDPPRGLTFEWRGPAPLAVMNVEPLPTWVRVRFEPRPEGEGTELLLEHHGFGSGEDWSRAWDFFERAWRSTLDGLVRRYARLPELRRPERLGAPGPSYVAFLRPGPAWVEGLPAGQQPRILNHTAYMLQLMEAGVAWVGGPLVDRPGEGMSILLGERAAVERYLRADPAVQAGVFVYELVEWRAALPREGLPRHGGPSPP